MTPSKPQAGAGRELEGLGLGRGIRLGGGCAGVQGTCKSVCVCGDSRECLVCAFTSVLAGCACVCVSVVGICAHLYY